MKVLVVEDDPPSRIYFMDTVVALGYECIGAENGKIALEKWESFQPDFILSDIRMPVMDGLELLEAVRRRDSDVIVVMATAFGSEEYTIKALRLGAHDYLKKPVRHEELGRTLKKYARLIEDRSMQQDVAAMVVRRECDLVFDNNLGLVGKTADYLMRETGNRLSRRDRTAVLLGLGELLMNAVEHGNLGITYEEKSEAMDKSLQDLDRLYRERGGSPELATRKVWVEFVMNDRFAEWRITDEGAGFDWREMPDPTAPENLMASHGRGILLCRMQFDELEFLGKGNMVRVRKNLSNKPGLSTGKS
jgi:DNA-binding response OmpR family regulator